MQQFTPNTGEFDIQTARTLANTARRAQTLWADGYSLDAIGSKPGVFFVTTPLRPAPNGFTQDTYQVFCSPEVGNHCTCPLFAALNECKHHLAVAALIEEAADNAKADAYDALMASAETSTGCDPYARY